MISKISILTRVGWISVFEKEGKIFKIIFGKLKNKIKSKILDNFKKKVSDNLALDGGEYLTYLAPSIVNLNLAIERWPEITFTKTREH